MQRRLVLLFAVAAPWLAACGPGVLTGATFDDAGRVIAARGDMANLTPLDFSGTGGDVSVVTTTV